MRKQGYEEWQANSIINITIVDDYLNKHSIRGRAPSEYLAAFSDENPNLDAAMATHLIDDPAAAGIWEDDYERFVSERSARVFQELSRRLGSTLKVDHGGGE